MGLRKRGFLGKMNEEIQMRMTRYSGPQIFSILRQAAGGMPVTELCRKHGVSNASFYRSLAKYRGTNVSMITQSKLLENTDQRLKKMFAELSMQADLLNCEVKGQAQRQYATPSCADARFACARTRRPT